MVGKGKERLCQLATGHLDAAHPVIKLQYLFDVANEIVVKF